MVQTRGVPSEPKTGKTLRKNHKQPKNTLKSHKTTLKNTLKKHSKNHGTSRHYKGVPVFQTGDVPSEQKT